jgi:hypothetical protein
MGAWKTAKMALHSDHYGDWIPNHAIRLAQLVASMKDGRGRTTIEVFYRDLPPLTAPQGRISMSVPDDEQALLKLFCVAHPTPLTITRAVDRSNSPHGQEFDAQARAFPYSASKRLHAFSACGSL